MALTKVTYVDDETVIGAQNLNDIQDEIISNADNINNNTDDISNNATAILNLQTFQGDVADYPVEYGTASGWDYRKWNSGEYECWYRSPSNINVACTYAWSTLYYGTIDTINFPITFIDYPIMSVTVQAGAGGCWAAPDYPSKSQTGPIYMYRPISSTINCRVNVYAFGRWK